MRRVRASSARRRQHWPSSRRNWTPCQALSEGETDGREARARRHRGRAPIHRRAARGAGQAVPRFPRPD
ncbi:MAG: hypothetical protein MZV70_01895 [Desulfobacterales bacterium]|nr:hypothetical protein [Desulfobacterales bacterium]